MSVYLELVDHNKEFLQLRVPPVIINDLVDASEEDREKIKSRIFTTFDSDVLSSLPSCECGELTGQYNLGVVCNNCNTFVTSPMDQQIEPIIWLRSPNGVQKLINPSVLIMLNKKFTISGFSLLQWVTDTSYSPKVKTPPILNDIIAKGISRGYNYFVENFDHVIETFFTLRALRNKNSGTVDELYTLIKNQRQAVFTTHIPLPNKLLLVVEKQPSAAYVDPLAVNAVDAIQSMVGIDAALTEHTVRVKENRTAKALVKLSEFHLDYATNTLGKKSGIFRKHVFGTRCHFAFRAVISSLTGPHAYNEIHIPWIIGLSVFKIHIYNKLIKRGFDINKATSFINEHANKYHPVLEEIFGELINESPNQGICVIYQRNPSLKRGSAQRGWITKVKSDPDDPTCGISILSVRSLNALKKAT